MAIESRTSIGNTRIVLPKHDVDRVEPDGRSRQDGKRGRKEQQETEPRPVSNDRGQVTGKLIDVTV